MDRDSSGKRVEKRNRPPVSCEPCRTRKLKCNRGFPCDGCAKRGHHCRYAANASRGKVSKPRDVKDRLHTLEDLVSSLLSGEAIIQPSQTTRNESIIANDSMKAANNHLANNHSANNQEFANQADTLTPEAPHLQSSGDGRVNYLDPSHWLSILDDIKEVRDHLSASAIQSQPIPQFETGMPLDNGAVSDASFLFGAQPKSSLDEILTSLPPQPICDTLLSWYFNSKFMVLGIVHPAKFQDEYEHFWQSPSSTPPLWIALLFSVLGVAAGLRQVSNVTESAGSLPPIAILQQRTVQCLVLGRYATANEHALEAFILHLQSCFFANQSGSVDLWFGMGTVIRLALRMGYHRDPIHLTGISPFDGEMRRRVWLNIFQIDALMSFQMGFPSMIPIESCDSNVPRNLEHSDLQVDMHVLPPSRPLTEQTPVQYVIVKSSIMAVFKQIVGHTQALSGPTYEGTVALDAEMKDAYSKVPEPLQRRDVNRSFLDHSTLIWQRCTIEILYLKGLVILHRRCISSEFRSSGRWDFCYRSCILAALDILARQADLHKACEPGGRLYEDRWMILSLPVQDFLLAAMVLCLDLSVRIRSHRSGGFSVANRTGTMESDDFQQLAGKEYRALQTSQRIWATNAAASPEASIATLALDLMIKKVAENGLGLLPMQDASWTETNTEGLVGSELPYAGSMAQMIDGAELVDWGLLDQFFLNTDFAGFDMGTEL